GARDRPAPQFIARASWTHAEVDRYNQRPLTKACPALLASREGNDDASSRSPRRDGRPVPEWSPPGRAGLLCQGGEGSAPGPDGEDGRPARNARRDTCVRSIRFPEGCPRPLARSGVGGQACLGLERWERGPVRGRLVGPGEWADTAGRRPAP